MSKSIETILVESRHYLSYLEEDCQRNPHRRDEFRGKVMHQLVEVLAGRMIHLHDERWNWDAAMPVVREQEIDAWRFTFRQFDNSRYMEPTGGDRPEPCIAILRTSRCQVSERQVPGSGWHWVFQTPSGRKFKLKKEKGEFVPPATLRLRWKQAADLFLSYTAPADWSEKATALQEAVGAFLKRWTDRRGLREAVDFFRNSTPLPETEREFIRPFTSRVDNIDRLHTVAWAFILQEGDAGFAALREAFRSL
ncbi:MAG: hypothetical protein HYV32_01060 [Candidatus Kerfeldbacteria bacterium]|nr:hypothetical protein [Candidatus Kerfeldbacteria bacterium]